MQKDILGKFSTPAKGVLARAQEFSKRMGVFGIEPEHILLGLLNQKNGLAGEILKKAGVKQGLVGNEVGQGDINKKEENRLPSDTRTMGREDVRVDDLEEEFNKLIPETFRGVFEATNRVGRENGGGEMRDERKGESAIKFENLKLKLGAQKIIERAVGAAARFGHAYVGSEHLLLGLLETRDGQVDKILKESRVDKERLKNNLNIILGSTAKFSDLVGPASKRSNFLRQLATGEMMGVEASEKTALETFGINLTSRMVQKNIDPVVGRGIEIERLINILSRRTKNNPILIGEPGVGKTAIVEGLAKKIVMGEVPDILVDKKIYNLDLGLLVAGTSFRGDFENRIKQVIAEVKRDSDIILFIDEIHNMIGAGSAQGTMDAANLLKPALSKGEIRCIGATTPNEYKKHIEPDPALERRFQGIFVNESTREETVELIRNIAQYYEKYHQVKITNEAIEAAVGLSDRYIQDKFLPDKAIDLIDEASSSKKVKKANTGLASEIKALKWKVAELSIAKEEYVKREIFDKAMKLKDEEEKMIYKIMELKREQEKMAKKILGKVTDNDIVEIISRITKIPAGQIAWGGKIGKSEQGLEQRLNGKIIGQKEVTLEVTQVIRKHLSGLAHPNRPLGSFMFLGPSGVGKTEMAKILAQELFHDERALIRFDMTEFGEGFGVSKLIGAPAGYVGYRESGKLTEAVKNRPYSIVLFDEIEKAHKEVRNLLLQILEEGRLTDATGKEINFKNTLIVMTSNIGLSDLNKAQRLGFGEIDDAGLDYERVKEKVLENLKKDFNPEFLNRIDKTLVFRPLSMRDLEKIVELQIGELGERLSERGLEITISDTARKFIAKESFSADAGAREIRKKISDLVEGPLAEKILGSGFGAGVVKVDVVGGNIDLSV